MQASEPIFNVLLAACLFGEFRPMTVNLSLIPIAAGVVLASVSEASYNVSCVHCVNVSALSINKGGNNVCST